MKNFKYGRGYFGIAIYHPKNYTNMGTLWRTAHSLGAQFIATIGRRYKHQSSDTTKATKHIPMFHFETFEDFKNFLPLGCKLTAVEIDEKAQDLRTYNHSLRECYLMGAEDYGIPQDILKQCNGIVKLNTKFCLNVAVAGSIVMYDRLGEKIC